MLTLLEPAGGIVDLLDGVALRVVPGTVSQPTMVETVVVPGEPGVVRPTLVEGGTLLKDVELVFRYPETTRQSPTRPVFYVFRTFLAADGQVRSSTVDYGHVEGSGAEARVVSASSPLFGHRWHRGAAEYAEPGGSVVCSLTWTAAPGVERDAGHTSGVRASADLPPAWRDLRRFGTRVGRTAEFACQGLAVAGGRAFVAETSDVGRPEHAHTGYLRTFDVRDPVSLPEVAPRSNWARRPSTSPRRALGWLRPSGPARGRSPPACSSSTSRGGRRAMYQRWRSRRTMSTARRPVWSSMATQRSSRCPAVGCSSWTWSAAR